MLAGISGRKTLKKNNCLFFFSEGKELAGRGGAGRKSKEENKSSDPMIMMMKLDAEVKKFKCDLHLSRNRENELREKIVHYMSSKYFTFM